VTTAEVIRVTPEWADVRIGKLETRLPRKEWIDGEGLKRGDLIKVYVIDVRKDRKGPKILISRAVPEFIIGVVKEIAREPGVRTKVAVTSTDPRVDPVGACIGEGGQRISAVLKEMRGEKIDVFKWSDDPRQLIANSLAPASVTSVEILDSERKAVRVLVPPTQTPDLPQN